jgi:hypothetical protein
MCDEQHLNVQKIQQSVAMKEPKIIVQRSEEIFPSLKESLVSDVCLCAQKQMIPTSSLDLHGQIT